MAHESDTESSSLFALRLPRPKIISALRDYSKTLALRDMGAALTVAVVALPLAMAFAIASHVSPERGLFTAIIGGFLISALGGSRFAIGGPTGAFVVIIAGVVDRFGYEGLVMTTLIAGAMLVIMGLANLGKLIKFIPYPVTTGFTSGIAVLIFVSQIKDFFGLALDKVPSEFVPKMIALTGAFGTINWATTAVGLVALVGILSARRFFPKVPGPIVGVVAATLLVWLTGLPVETIGTRFGGIPSSLPAPVWPHFDLSRLRELFPDAMTIALLAGIESLLCCVVADGMTGDKHDSATELMGQGFANIASVVFGGIPATGAVARTVTGIKSGAASPLTGILHAIILIAFMLVAAPLASAIPLAALSAVLFLVAFDMSEYHKFARLLRAPRSDVAVLILTFLLTVLVDLTVAVYVGVLLASLLFMRRMSEMTAICSCQLPGMHGARTSATELLDFKESNRDEDLDQVALTVASGSVPEGVQIYEIDGPFFFGVVDRFQDVLNAVRERPKIFILELTHAQTIDSTGVHALESFMGGLKRRKIELFLVGMRPHFFSTLHRFGTDDMIGHDHIYANLDEALAAARSYLSLHSSN